MSTLFGTRDFVAGTPFLPSGMEFSFCLRPFFSRISLECPFRWSAGCQALESFLRFLVDIFFHRPLLLSQWGNPEKATRFSPLLFVCIPFRSNLFQRLLILERVRSFPINQDLGIRFFVLTARLQLAPRVLAIHFPLFSLVVGDAYIELGFFVMPPSFHFRAHDSRCLNLFGFSLFPPTRSSSRNLAKGVQRSPFLFTLGKCWTVPSVIFLACTNWLGSRGELWPTYLVFFSLRMAFSCPNFVESHCITRGSSDNRLCCA